MTTISRRNFIRASALVGAGMLGASALSGCSGSAHADESSKPEPTEFFECDVLVCGTGTSGLCAASHAAELGADVLVVDGVFNHWPP